MTTPARTGWPAVDKALVPAIRDLFGGHVATKFPGAIVEMARNGTAVVRVRRVGGSNPDRHTDQSRVVVDVIHADEDSAEALAEAIRVWLSDTRPIRGGGVLLDGAVAEVAPVNVNFPDPDVAQYSATYLVSARRVSAM